MVQKQEDKYAGLQRELDDLEVQANTLRQIFLLAVTGETKPLLDLANRIYPNIDVTQPEALDREFDTRAEKALLDKFNATLGVLKQKRLGAQLLTDEHAITKKNDGGLLQDDEIASAVSEIHENLHTFGGEMALMSQSARQQLEYLTSITGTDYTTQYGNKIYEAVNMSIKVQDDAANREDLESQGEIYTKMSATCYIDMAKAEIAIIEIYAGYLAMRANIMKAPIPLENARAIEDIVSIALEVADKSLTESQAAITSLGNYKGPVFN